jgi:hypothetical protein
MTTFLFRVYAFAGVISAIDPASTAVCTEIILAALRKIRRSTGPTSGNGRSGINFSGTVIKMKIGNTNRIVT